MDGIPQVVRRVDPALLEDFFVLFLDVQILMSFRHAVEGDPFPAHRHALGAIADRGLFVKLFTCYGTMFFKQKIIMDGFRCLMYTWMP